MAAALHYTSVLCGGFSPSNLLGVSQDKEDHVLVSFRAVIRRYNITERQEVRSWTTKSWHPFTCSAVYQSAEDRVVGVASNTILTTWQLDDLDLDKCKKSNFETPIHGLLACGDAVFVVFASGQVEKLSTKLLASRKDPKPGFLGPGETITYVEIIKEANVVVMVVEKENSHLTLYQLQLGESICQPQDSNILAYNNAFLTGVCATSTARLITLWSTGEVYTFDLQDDYLEKLPGRLHASEQHIKADKPTKILELSPSHIAIIGMDKGDEGGLIVLRDIKFGLATSTQRLKMYHKPPRAWVTLSGLVVMEGGSLALIPYTVKEPNLATVFGSRISETQGFPSEVCHSWVKKENADREIVPKEATETIYSNKSKGLNKVLKSINRGALSESMLVAEVVAHLIKLKKLKLLLEALDTCVDIPEASMVDALDFFLDCRNMEFEGLCQFPHMQLEFDPQEEDSEKIVCPFSTGKAYFINAVLRKPFTDVQLLEALPKISFDHALSLIKYLHFLIAAGEAELSPADKGGTPSLSQTALWLSLLLDTNYHQLVMSSEVAIHRLLLSCLTQVSGVIKFLEGMADIELLARRIVRSQVLPKHTHTSAPYSLERLVLS